MAPASKKKSDDVTPVAPHLVSVDPVEPVEGELYGIDPGYEGSVYGVAADEEPSESKSVETEAAEKAAAEKAAAEKAAAEKAAAEKAAEKSDGAPAAPAAPKK